MSKSTTSNVKNFEGRPLSYYTLDIWGKSFQVLEAEAQQNLMPSPEGINRTKGEGVNTEKRFVPLIEASL